VSVFTEILMEQMGLTRLQLSTAYLVGTCTSGFILPAAGVLLDRLGARRMVTWVSLAFGAVLISHIFLDEASAQLARISAGLEFLPVWLLPFLLMCFAFFSIRFLGQGCIPLGSRAMLGKWFNKRRGIVFSLSGVALSFCFSLAPQLLKNLIDAVGWEGAYMVLGLAVAGITGTVAWAFFRETPEEIGQNMDGTPDDAPPAEKEKNLDLIIRREMTRPEALRTYAFWAYNLSLSFFALVNTGYTFNILSIGNESGVGEETILKLFIPMAFVSVTVNLLAGWLADRTRLKYILFAFSLALCLTMLGLILLPSMAGKVCLVLGWGIGGGIFNMLSGVVWPRYFGRAHLGAISGAHLASTVFGSALGPVTFSLAQEFGGSYFSAYFISLVISGLLAGGALFADNPQRKVAAPDGEPSP
jgi:sugar phosphate permease